MNVFRCCAHEVIDTLAFCSVLIDAIDGVVYKLRQTADKKDLRSALHQCEVLHEHIQQNHKDLGMTETSALQLYSDDFKVMINECKACLASTIDPTRVRKRFRILLSVLKNIQKSLENHNSDKKCSGAESKAFTFGHVTAPSDSKIASNVVKSISDSLEMAIDLDEFISKNGCVTHGSVFYDTKKKHSQLQSFAQNTSGLLGDEHTPMGNTPKRASKRTLNVNMNYFFFSDQN